MRDAKFGEGGGGGGRGISSSCSATFGRMPMLAGADATSWVAGNCGDALGGYGEGVCGDVVSEGTLPPLPPPSLRVAYHIISAARRMPSTISATSCPDDPPRGACGSSGGIAASCTVEVGGGNMTTDGTNGFTAGFSADVDGVSFGTPGVAGADGAAGAGCVTCATGAEGVFGTAPFAGAAAAGASATVPVITASRASDGWPSPPSGRTSAARTVWGPADRGPSSSEKLPVPDACTIVALVAASLPST
jgi:hypothetical protein